MTAPPEPPPPPDKRVHVTWLNSERTIPARFVRPLLRFTQVAAASGVVLLIAAAAALVWANAPFGESYERFWETHLELSVGGFHLEESLRDLVNDGLMVIFFFVVGLEIKRELVVGDLRDPKAATLPLIAALGGMLGPALIYLAIAGGGEATRGWGIPMATDIAFSIGVVALLGSRVPVGAKLFLLALAIVDDIGAIVVIAVFYTDELLLGYLGAAIGGLAVVWIGQRVGVRSLTFYVPVAVATWFFLLESGVHATLAGVALGLLTPAYAWYSDEEYQRKAQRLIERYGFQSHDPMGPERVDHTALQLSDVARESVSPLNRLENALHPWSSFVVIPIFALANAGVRFAGVDLVEAATHPVAMGVTIGLLVGKTIGISLFTWLAVKLRLGVLPRLTGWSHIVGVAAVAGIGFTVSLFITVLAFDGPLLVDRARIGIFIGSTLAGVLGYTILRLTTPQSPDRHPQADDETAQAWASDD